MTQPTVFIVAFRPFDHRLFIDSGLIEHLVHYANVVVVGPEEVEADLVPSLPGQVHYRYLRYATDRVQGGADLAENHDGWRGRLRGLIDQCLRLVYARGRTNRENSTGTLHRRTFLQGLREQPFLVRISGLGIWVGANIANRSRLFRLALQSLYGLFTRFENHRALFKELKPDLVVLPSAGLSVDGWFLAEAKRHSVPAVVVSQSWDRTSSKGYPTLPPDYVVVWNQDMHQEVVDFWDMDPKCVFTEGAPIWDGHFLPTDSGNRETFLTERGLDPSKKTIYISLTGPAWHENNIKIVLDIVSLRQREGVLFGVNLLVRIHPNYMSEVFRPKLEEITASFEAISEERDFYFELPDAVQTGNSYMLAGKHDADLHRIFAHTDLMVSIPSSQMIEAAIFDVPYVEINYGRWRNVILDVDLGERKLEHFERLRHHKAGALCNRPEDLYDLLVQELTSRDKRKRERRELAEHEAGTNKGHSARSTAERISEIAKSHRAANALRSRDVGVQSPK